MVLNLCLDDEAARLMGVENHVCEVQIVLAALAGAPQVDPSRSSLALRLLFPRRTAQNLIFPGGWRGE